MTLQSLCPDSWQTGWRACGEWEKEDKAGGWGKRGKEREKREKEVKPQGLSLSAAVLLATEGAG